MVVMLYVWNLSMYSMACFFHLERVKHVEVCVSIQVQEGLVVLENL